MSLRRQVGDAIRALRVARGLTQDDLADAAATTQRRISMIESGRHGLRVDTLERIADALGAEVALLHVKKDIDPPRLAA